MPKVAFIDMYPGYEDVLTTSLPFSYFISRGWQVVRADENPDIVVASVFRRSYSFFPNTKKILWSGENLSIGTSWRDHAFLQDVDYALVTNYPECTYFPSRIETYFTPYGGIHYNYEDIRLSRNKYLKGKGEERPLFCCFVSSNSYNLTGYILRDYFFSYVSTYYKRVDSGGRYLRNIPQQAPRDEEEYLKWLSKYKFMICFENSLGEGYMTEKIFAPYAAGCIPIYWGDSSTLRYINKKAYIPYTTPEETLQRIIELDQDEDKYRQMQQEELLTPEGREVFAQKRVEAILDKITSFN